MLMMDYENDSEYDSEDDSGDDYGDDYEDKEDDDHEEEEEEEDDEDDEDIKSWLYPSFLDKRTSCTPFTLQTPSQTLAHRWTPLDTVGHRCTASHPLSQLPSYPKKPHQ